MERKKKVYISGPMSGLERKVYLQRFAIAESILRAHGYDTINPTRVWSCRWPWLYRIVGYKLTLLYDLWLLMTKADAIVSLPASSMSRGASIEQYVSHWIYLYGIDPKINEEIRNAINNNKV
jgi:hypothetical protein